MIDPRTKMLWRVPMLTALVILLFVIGAYAAGDVVSPATCTFSQARGQDTMSASADSYWRSDTFLLTNIFLSSDTDTNGVAQGLSNVTVGVNIGSIGNFTPYTATVASVTGGTWWLSATVPTSGTVYIETTITDTNGNSYTYGWKTLSARYKL